MLQSCDDCPRQFKTKKHLKQHISEVHDGIIYPCEKCDYKAGQKRGLSAHMSVKHEGK